jgi:hypothetical protein
MMQDNFLTTEFKAIDLLLLYLKNLGLLPDLNKVKKLWKSTKKLVKD